MFLLLVALERILVVAVVVISETEVKKKKKYFLGFFCLKQDISVTLLCHSNYEILTNEIIKLGGKRFDKEII